MIFQNTEGGLIRIALSDGRSSFPDLIGLLRLLFFPHFAVMHLVDPRQPVF